MYNYTNNTTMDDNIDENHDILFYFLVPVLSITFFCMTCCFFVNKHKKNNRKLASQGSFITP